VLWIDELSSWWMLPLIKLTLNVRFLSPFLSSALGVIIVTYGWIVSLSTIVIGVYNMLYMSSKISSCTFGVYAYASKELKNSNPAIWLFRIIDCILGILEMSFEVSVLCSEGKEGLECKVWSNWL